MPEPKKITKGDGHSSDLFPDLCNTQVFFVDWIRSIQTVQFPKGWSRRCLLLLGPKLFDVPKEGPSKGILNVTPPVNLPFAELHICVYIYIYIFVVKGIYQTEVTSQGLIDQPIGGCSNHCRQHQAGFRKYSPSVPALSDSIRRARGRWRTSSWSSTRPGGTPTCRSGAPTPFAGKGSESIAVFKVDPWKPRVEPSTWVMSRVHHLFDTFGGEESQNKDCLLVRCHVRGKQH